MFERNSACLPRRGDLRDDFAKYGRLSSIVPQTRWIPIDIARCRNEIRGFRSALFRCSMEFSNSACLCFNDSGILKFPRVRVGKATDFGIVGVNLAKEDQTFRLSDRTAAKRSGTLRVRALSAKEEETFRFVDQTCRFRSDIGVCPDGSGEKQTNLGIFADHGANIRGSPRLWPPIPRSNNLLRKSDARAAALFGQHSRCR